MSTAADQQTARLTERVQLKMLVESCLVVEEELASIRDVDLGMMAGAGIVPPPFAHADAIGLDERLAALERAEAESGENFAPPRLLRRLVAQGRLGQKSGQGFFAYPRPDPDFEQGEALKLETRGATAIVWLDRPPANSISPQVIDELGRIWRALESSGTVRAMVIASANPALFSAGADIKGFAKMDEAGGRKLLEDGHALLRSFERSKIVTIAAVNALAVGGGCELAMGCDVRIAALSASFGQPEINLGIMPGFGGTQRLPRLVGESMALQMNLTGEAISAEDALDAGLVNAVVADHELFDTALAWARKLGGQAPLAIEQIKRVSANGDLDAGIDAEKQAFAGLLASEDASEGISAFLAKRSPRFKGR